MMLYGATQATTTSSRQESCVRGMCMAVTRTHYMVTTNLVTMNLKRGKHGGTKQRRVNKNWCPQKYIYILARTCHVTSPHGLIAYLFILIYCSIPYYTS